MPRTCSLHLAAAGVALLTALTTHAESPQRFLFGGDFPMQASEQVKSLFWESGMNCIRLTGGGYGWAAAGHKKLADEFQSRGLYVYLQLGSHYPSADYFPLKDAYLVDQAGQTGVEDRQAWSITYSGEHWPQYSYAHEGFRRQLEGDFANYLKSFAENSNAAGVILHNEPGFFWLTDRVFDYGAPALASFRTYLEKEHGTIQKLNERWGTTYASFAEVIPPGKPPVQNIAAWMDWRRYSAAQVADFMAWESDWFSGQRKDIPRTTNLAGPLDHWFGYRCAQNDILSAKMDAAGIDIYPTQWTDRVFIPYSVDLTHGVAQGRPVHVLETDTFSDKLWKYSEEERADMLRGELWTLIGHGARTVLVWGFSRGDDFSLTNGEFNPRYRAARDIAHTTKMLSIDDFARPHPQVALCVDPDSYIYASGTEAKPHQLSPAEDTEAHGLYAALSDAHIPTDVILTPQLRSGVWKNYKAIVLANHRMMDEQTAAQLEQFVTAGGTLLADTPLAEMDRWGKRYETVPGAGLDRLFAASGSTDTRQHGKGATALLGNQAGAAYLNGGSPDLVKRLRSALLPGLQAPRVQVTPATAQQLDTSILQDPKGNLLITATTLGAKGKPAPAIANAELSIITGQPIPRPAAFIFLPTREQNGTITSGPQALAAESDKPGIVSLKLHDITSATPILLPIDAPPLLALSSPSHATRGQEITVTITCYNPSPRQLEGTLSLHTNPKDQSPVSVPANGKADVQFKLPISATATPGRTVVNAILNVKGGTPTLGIPVDVQVD